MLASIVVVVVTGCGHVVQLPETTQLEQPGSAVVVPPLPSASVDSTSGTASASADQPPALPPQTGPDGPPASGSSNETPPPADRSAAGDSTGGTDGSGSSEPGADLEDAVERGVRVAALRGVEQSVAVVDRSTGAVVAASAGDATYDSESLTKLFTAAYYLVDSDGEPEADLAAQLRAMIVDSDDDVQTALWQEDIVPAMAERYRLSGTELNATSSPDNWGSDQVTADDMARFLASMSVDPVVAPDLTRWMRLTAPTGLDGFDQDFGFNALTGDHGSKQGWSDLDYYPVTVHSVGWTPRYFAAILQRSESADYATLRLTATYTARLIAGS